jgi:hypothetical protein
LSSGNIGKVMDYSLTEAQDADWEFILQCSAEAVGVSLPEARKRQIGREAIAKHDAMKIKPAA